jgi:hypothetical protein
MKVLSFSMHHFSPQSEKMMHIEIGGLRTSNFSASTVRRPAGHDNCDVHKQAHSAISPVQRISGSPTHTTPTTNRTIHPRLHISMSAFAALIN